MDIKSNLIKQSDHESIFDSVIDGKRLRVIISAGPDGVTDNTPLKPDETIHVLSFTETKSLTKELVEPVLEANNGDLVIIICTSPRAYNYAVMKFNNNFI